MREFAMKSQVGLGRLYPDGQLEQAHDIPVNEQAQEARRETATAHPSADDLVTVVVHLEKSSLDELLQRPPSQ
jgi:hypothetical protein